MKRKGLFILLLVPLILVAFYPPASREQIHYSGAIYDSILTTVIRYTKRNYLDPSSIDPVKMLAAGLGRLEKEIDEVLVEFPYGEDGPSFIARVMDERKVFHHSSVVDMETMADKMEEVFQFVFPRVDGEKYKPHEVEYAVVDAMLKSLDPHSGIITPKVYKEFMVETEGSFGGLGIVIGIRDGQLTVIAPIEGTPAYRVGIKPKDKIVQIEDESTINMSLIEAVSKLRGPKGTAVNINVMRDAFTDSKLFTIIRDTIKIESVEAFDLGGGIGYLRIRDFQKNTLSSLREHLGRLKSGGRLEGLILDFRGNPGGLLNQAQKIADLFLESGVIVTTRIGASDKNYKAKPSRGDFKGKLAVLVDSGSASASEIVAGALRNNDRAIVIGERTFGKSSVQQIFDLDDGSALKLTIAKYLTPGEKSIHDVGITPDILVIPVTVGKEFVRFKPLSAYIKDKKLEGKNLTLEEPSYSVSYLDTSSVTQDDSEEITPEEALSTKEKRKKIENDFYVNTAKEILMSVNARSRQQTILKARREINRVALIEEVKIEKQLRLSGIDWSKGKTAPGVPEIGVTVHPSTPKGKAGEGMPITITIKNTGSVPLYRLTGFTKTDNPIFNGKEFVFGKVEPGQTKSWKIKVKIPKTTLTHRDEITLRFRDDHNHTIPDYKFNVEVQELPRPSFAFNYEIIDDGRYSTNGNGDGIPEPGETVGVLLKLKNSGPGVSQKCVVTLKNLSGDKVFLEKGRFQFDNFMPGELKEAPLLFTLRKDIPEIELQLVIFDDVLRKGVVEKIKIPRHAEDTTLKATSTYASVLMNMTPVRGGSFTEASLVGYLQKGAVTETSGRTRNWVKVVLDEDSFGWVKSDSISFLAMSSTGNSHIKHGGFEEVLSSPPTITLKSYSLSTPSGEINVRGIVEDPDGVGLISIFVGEDKVKLLPSSKDRVPFSTNVKLKEGINYITVFAKDSYGLTSKKSIMVRRLDSQREDVITSE